MSIERQITLLYMSDKKQYNPDAPVEHDDYYITRQMPKREMFGTNTVELAEGLIEVTTSVEWRRQQRRPIMCGDIVCEGLDAWMYVLHDDVKDQADTEKALQLRAWPRYAIKRIPSDSLKETICKK